MLIPTSHKDDHQRFLRILGLLCSHLCHMYRSGYLQLTTPTLTRIFLDMPSEPTYVLLPCALADTTHATSERELPSDAAIWGVSAGETSSLSSLRGYRTYVSGTVSRLIHLNSDHPSAIFWQSTEQRRQPLFVWSRCLPKRLTRKR